MKGDHRSGAGAIWLLRSSFGQTRGEESLAAVGQAENLRSHGNPLWHSALFYSSPTGDHLDLGSNAAASLRGLDPTTITCVEAHAPAAAKLRETYPRVIEGDACRVVEAMIQTGDTFDRVTAFDFIEHLPKSEGERLLANLERVARREIVLFFPMEGDEVRRSPKYKDYMESIFRGIPTDQQGLQSHKSTWTPEELRERGYDVLVLPDFHTEGFSAFFAAKYENPLDRQSLLSRLPEHVEVEFPFLPPSFRRRRPGEPGFGLVGPGTEISRPLKVINPAHILLGANIAAREGAWLEAITEYAGQAYQPVFVIDDGCRIENFVHIGAAKMVYLGKEVMIASRVTVLDHHHGYHDVAVPPLRQPLDVGEVFIDDGVRLGESVTVCKDVYIGKHAVIGANAVVTRDVPAFSVAAGNPARIIKRFNSGNRTWEAAMSEGSEGNPPETSSTELQAIEERKSFLRVASLGQALAAKNLILVERDATIAERDATIAERDAALAGKDSEIARLRQEVSHWRNTVERYHKHPFFRVYFALKRALGRAM